MSPNLHATRIMLADDHAVVRLGFRLLLEGVGAEVVAEADDGTEALAAIKEHQPAVALLDYRMPGEDGISLAARMRLRENIRGLVPTPIIGVTAHALPEELGAFHAAGMSEVLKKPIDRGQLVGLLARLSAILKTRDSARSSRSSLVRPCGSKPASAISFATEIISRTTARSRTISA